MEGIKLYKYKDMDLEGATVIEGFPTVGLVSTIAANYLIGALNLDQITAMDAEGFPPLSMIYASKPKLPARIYAHEKKKIAVFLAEFKPKPSLARPIAETILNWASENKCKRIITSEGIPLRKAKKEIQVYGVGSAEESRRELEKRGIPPLPSGMITGVTGALLNLGRLKDANVISLLVEVHPNIPDARAAAAVIEKIDAFIPYLRIDVRPLYKEAEEIEGRLKHLIQQAKPAKEGPPLYG